MEELKDNSKKSSRGKIVEYKMKVSDAWKTGKIHAQPKSNGKYSHWLNIEPEAENENPVCIKWDLVDQWRELSPIRVEVSNQEYVVLLTSELEQAKEEINWYKGKRKRKYENSWSILMLACDIGQICNINKMGYNREIQR